MATDKFLGGVQIPDVGSGSVTPAEVGFIRIIARGTDIWGVLEDGNEVLLSGSSSGADIPTFIQETQPVHAGKYLWIQTNIDGNPDDFTFWFEDGL